MAKEKKVKQQPSGRKKPNVPRAGFRSDKLDYGKGGKIKK